MKIRVMYARELYAGKYGDDFNLYILLHMSVLVHEFFALASMQRSEIMRRGVIKRIYCYIQ